MDSAALGRLVLEHLERAAILDLVTPGVGREFGVVELSAAAPDSLRFQLERRGWRSDPLPWLRRRTKSWVTWGLREYRPGPALHLEAEVGGGFSIHLDAANPVRLRDWPRHLWIDYYGWKTRRVEALLRLA